MNDLCIQQHYRDCLRRKTLRLEANRPVRVRRTDTPYMAAVMRFLVGAGFPPKRVQHFLGAPKAHVRAALAESD